MPLICVQRVRSNRFIHQVHLKFMNKKNQLEVKLKFCIKENDEKKKIKHLHSVVFKLNFDDSKMFFAKLFDLKEQTVLNIFFQFDQ